MPTPGKRGGGFAPGSAADRVVKKRAKKLLASQGSQLAEGLRVWASSRPPAISSVAHVEAIFDQIAAMFRAHGKPDPILGGDPLYIGDYGYCSVANNKVLGPFETVFGPKIVVHRRPQKEPAKFGWLERIDIRSGSPTAMLALVAELRELTK